MFAATIVRKHPKSAARTVKQSRESRESTDRFASASNVLAADWRRFETYLKKYYIINVTLGLRLIYFKEEVFWILSSSFLGLFFRN